MKLYKLGLISTFTLLISVQAAIPDEPEQCGNEYLETKQAICENKFMQCTDKLSDCGWAKARCDAKMRKTAKIECETAKIKNSGGGTKPGGPLF